MKSPPRNFKIESGDQIGLALWNVTNEGKDMYRATAERQLNGFIGQFV
jgi:hypothetical protein